MNSKNIFKYGIGLVILQIILFGLWIYEMEPDPSGSIAIILFAPILFGLNLITGLLLYFFKQPVSKLFFLNSLICPVIFYGLWNLWFVDYHERNNTIYKFSINSVVYELTIGKNNKYFYLSDQNNNGRAYIGTYELKGDSIILRDSEVEMYVISNKLIGFPESTTEIKLKETE